MKESYFGAGAEERLAPLGDRLGGQILDGFIAFAIVALSAIPLAMSETVGDVTLIGGVVLAVLYILFSDGFRGGQSYGKRMMRTAVVDATSGRPCSFGQSFARNLLLSILGIIDWAFIFGKKRQRLGDKAANTIVIRAL